jgi:hypothetical protein
MRHAADLSNRRSVTSLLRGTIFAAGVVASRNWADEWSAAQQADASTLEINDLVASGERQYTRL